MDFSTPFASNASRRSPTADEKINGFPCGPADQTLFNGLLYRLEVELGNLISYAGLSGSDADPNQVRQAVQALIAAAVGGDSASFLLMDQARARLPIYPEIVASDHRINIISPSAGTVQIPAGVTIMHRGVFPAVTELTNLTTVANKTYHLRWSPSGGWVLSDLSSSAYNPSGYAETHDAFDSVFDDMLAARVVTNSSNVATITNLANAHQLTGRGDTGQITPTTYQDNTVPSALVAQSGNYELVNLNWARRPLASMVGFTDVTVQTTLTGEMNVAVQSLSRYQLRCIYERGQSAGGAYVGWAARA